jgi:hypothetical protein
MVTYSHGMFAPFVPMINPYHDHDHVNTVEGRTPNPTMIVIKRPHSHSPGTSNIAIFDTCSADLRHILRSAVFAKYKIWQPHHCLFESPVDCLSLRPHHVRSYVHLVPLPLRPCRPRGARTAELSQPQLRPQLSGLRSRPVPPRLSRQLSVWRPDSNLL